MFSLNEAIRNKDFGKVSTLILKYLRSKLGAQVYLYPVPETVLPIGGKMLSGVRYFISGHGTPKSVRFNWGTTSTFNAQHCASVDFWDGLKIPMPNPSTHVKFEDESSLVKILPLVVDIVKGSITSSGVYVQEQVLESFSPVFSFSELNEANVASGDLTKTVANIIHALEQGVTFAAQGYAGGNKKYGPRWNKAADFIKMKYPEVLTYDGRKQVINKSKIKQISAQEVLKAIGGDGAVTFDISPGVKETLVIDGINEEDLDRMTYEEQLDALRTGMKLLMSNATNALFLGGRGGTGKTQTVEEMLASAGLSDGDGYFKITGSATPAGIYRILFQHRKEIVLFDDSDSALADQDGRNLFKTASDTKKVRKISWQKGGKSYVDPDDYNWDEEGEQDELPRSFEFTGKIIFISNLPLNKLDPDGALRTRGYVISIDPTNEEIYDYMLKIADKIKLEVDYNLSKASRLEVVEVLRGRKIADKSANLRSLVRGLNTRAGIEVSGGSAAEWQKFVKMFA